MTQGLPANSSVSSFEELELKEPTPSIAASLYESAQYSKKWRVLIALIVGGVLIGLCVLGFYVNAEARRPAPRDKNETSTATSEQSTDTSDEPLDVTNESDRPSASSMNEEPQERSFRWRKTDHSCEHIDLECPAGYSPPIVLLVAIDGVRREMITPTTAPALHHLAKCGVMADHLTPVYPTNTISNLYTVVTGLYPESHGIIGPVIYDVERNKTFRVGKYESYKSYWWAGEPIWNTMQNKSLHSAMYYWPGSYVQVGGRYPTFWYKYRNDNSLETGVNKIQEWLLLEEEERPSLLGLYFDTPDKVAQETGAYSKRANESLLAVDHQIDRLMNTLSERNLSSCVDIIIVSDHGTAPSSCGNSLYLETFMPDIDEKARVVTGAVGRLQAIPGKGSNSEILNQLRCKNPKLRALSKDLLPNRYHYANNKRIEDVILDTLPGNRIVTSDTNYCKKAEHGFNNIETSMQGIFIARGPSFKTNYKTAGFRNVEIYNLLNLLLGATPAPNNGTEGSLYHILRDPPPPPTISINEWHVNVLPFLHPRSRDPSFLEELRMPATQSTTTTSTTTSTSTTTPSTTTPESTTTLPSSTTSTPVVSEASIEAKESLENPDSSSTTTSSLPPTASTPIASPSQEGKILSFPGENNEEKVTDPPLEQPVDESKSGVLDVAPTTNITEKSAPVDEMDAPQGENESPSLREAKTVLESDMLEEEKLQTEGRVQNTPVLAVPAVIMSLADQENRSADSAVAMESSGEPSNTENNPVIAIGRKVEAVTQVIADVVAVATSDPISVKDESMLAPSGTTASTSTTTGSAVNLNISESDSLDVPSTIAPSVSTVPEKITTQKPSSSSPLNVSETSTSTSTTSTSSTSTSSTSTSSTSTSSTSPSTTSTSTTPEVTSTTSPATPSVTTPASTTSPNPAPAPELSAEPIVPSRKKRDTCECESSEILQTEKGRGQPARTDHISYHCPFGVPLFEAREAPKGTHYILPYTNHVNGYIGELGTALWTSFTLTNSSFNHMSEDTSDDAPSQDPCWLADPRLPRDPQQQCLEYLVDRYNTGTVGMRQLFPEEFESPEVLAREGYFLTNAIALKKGFAEGGRRSVIRLLRKWTALRSVVNVISGPIWDRNLNGRGDTIIHIRSRVDYLTPSHVFFIVSSCQASSGFDMDDPDLSKCSSDELDVLAFVFPNTDLDDNCLMNDRDYCRYHLTSLTDIQRLTGLQVFSTFTGEAALPALLAQQPLLLWDN